MELENALFGSENSTGREGLLVKCRDTINNLELELEQQSLKVTELESRLKEFNLKEAKYIQEIRNKTFQLDLLTNENAETEAKYQVFINKALHIQEQNELLIHELENSDKANKDAEAKAISQNNIIEKAQLEAIIKEDAIKSLNKSLESLECSLALLNEENYSLNKRLEESNSKTIEITEHSQDLQKQLKESQKKIEDLQKNFVSCSLEKDNVLQQIKVQKEKITYLDLELSTRTKCVSEIQSVAEELRSKLISQDLTMNEHCAKLNVTIEELKAMKTNNDYLENSIKEQTIKYRCDIEKHNIALENKTNFFNKEDSRKIQIITQLESDLKLVKDELENLIQADSLLQERYKRVASKNHRLKDRLKEKSEESLKLRNSLSKFEDKLKSIEKSSAADINSLQAENSNILIKHQEDLANQAKAYESKFEKLSKDYKSKLISLDKELKHHKEDLSTLKKNYLIDISSKDEEISLLNNDRNKLQLALTEMENKVIELSRTLEGSVSDCWKLSHELLRKEDSQQEELSNLRAFIKQQLNSKDEEILVQSETYTRRLKEKITYFHEKTSFFKENLRRELETLESSLHASPPPDFSNSLQRVQSLINNFMY